LPIKILLLQQAVYLPSFGGGNKANRFLLESLTRNGHQCVAVASPLAKRIAVTPRSDIDEMSLRGIEMCSPQRGLVSYCYRGVRVNAIDFPTVDESRAYVIHLVGEFQPDWILVSDDKYGFLLESAIFTGASRVVVLAHTNFHLPFGPMAKEANSQDTHLVRQARAVVAVSRYQQEYIRKYAGLDASLIHFPVYGPGPFPMLGRFESGFVTMINPCVMKGLPIFLALAKASPQIKFAAVPTWGADAEVMRDLRELSNVTVVQPADDIEEVLACTRVLVAPSLVPETFGYVVVEAMLRGIPVLASDIGGLREAKLGVDYSLPVEPAARQDGVYISPQQSIGPWSKALDEVLSTPEGYHRCALASREAALKFVASVSVSAFEEFLARLSV
jgi:glycosyltransferase involved in cell wall biosynthesis